VLTLCDGNNCHYSYQTCEEQCRADTLCYGYDFDLYSGRCRIFTQPVSYVTPRNGVKCNKCLDDNSGRRCRNLGEGKCYTGNDSNIKQVCDPRLVNCRLTREECQGDCLDNPDCRGYEHPVQGQNGCKLMLDRPVQATIGSDKWCYQCE
jgi:hypothetical protein